MSNWNVQPLTSRDRVKSISIDRTLGQPTLCTFQMERIIVDANDVSVSASGLAPISVALEIAAQNPNLLTQPVTKALIYDWAEKVGISPIKLEIAEAQQGNQQQPPQGQNPQQNAPGITTPPAVQPNPLQSLMSPQNAQPTR